MKMVHELEGETPASRVRKEEHEEIAYARRSFGADLGQAQIRVSFALRGPVYALVAL